MSSPRVLVAVALMSVSACGARQQTGIVGQGTAFVQPASCPGAELAHGLTDGGEAGARVPGGHHVVQTGDGEEAL